MTRSLWQTVAALMSGVVFGFGLALSGMLDPARVRGFLDIAGAWNPALAFVLGGAVIIAMIGVGVVRRMRRPLFDTAFHLPPVEAKPDRKLVGGSALFGVGWGLVGLCPGPAVASLVTGRVSVLIFVVAMVAGMVLHDRLTAAVAMASLVREDA